MLDIKNRFFKDLCSLKHTDFNKMYRVEIHKTFLCKFIRFFVFLGLKILRLFRLKVLFETDFLKGDVNNGINHKVPFFYFQLLNKSALNLQKNLTNLLKSFCEFPPRSRLIDFVDFRHIAAMVAFASMDTRCQFHQCLMGSFYACRSQKRKKYS
jgi:hypothetical protein